jgi:NitT/TauT family transport system substrate-binding protein
VYLRTRVRAAVCVCVAVALASVLAAQASASRLAGEKRATTSLTVAWNGVGINQTVVVLAKQAGLFPADLDVTVKTIPSTQQLASLSTGQVQFTIQSSPAPDLGAAAGAPIGWLASLQPYADIVLLGRPEITTMKDLKGKRVGITTPGTYSALMVNWALNQAGLTASDVSVAPLGTGAGLTAAFISGQVSALPSNPPLLQQQQAAVPSANVLYDFYATKTDWIASGVAAYLPWVKAHPQAAVEFLTGLNRAVKLFRSNPTIAKQMLRATLPGTTTSAEIDAGYEWAAKRMNAELKPVELHTTRNTRRFLIENGFDQMKGVLAKNLTFPAYVNQAVRPTKNK